MSQELTEDLISPAGTVTQTSPETHSPAKPWVLSKSIKESQTSLRRIMTTVPEATPGPNTFPVYVLRDDGRAVRGMAINMTRHSDNARNDLKMTAVFDSKELLTFYNVWDLVELYNTKREYNIRFIPLFTGAIPGNIVKSFKLVSVKNLTQHCCQLEFALQETETFCFKSNRVYPFEYHAFTMPDVQWNEIMRLDAQIDTTIDTSTCKSILFTGASSKDGVSTLAWWFSAGLSRLLSRRVLYVSPSYDVQNRPNHLSIDVNYKDDQDLMVVNFSKLQQVVENRSVSRTFNIIKALGERSFSHVIFDMPPVRESPVSAALADFVAGTFMVVQKGRTKRKHVESTIKILDEKDSQYLGTLINEG